MKEYKLPTREEYENEQEYQHALEGYCQAMDDYCDECKEKRAGL